MSREMVFRYAIRLSNKSLMIPFAELPSNFKSAMMIGDIFCVETSRQDMCDVSASKIEVPLFTGTSLLLKLMSGISR